MEFPLNLIPLSSFNLQALALKVLAALLLVLASMITGCVFGVRLEGKKHAEYVAAEARQAVAVVVKQGAVTERVVTRFVKVEAAREAVAATIANEVANAPDTGACLDTDWRRLHDRAAGGAAIP